MIRRPRAVLVRARPELRRWEQVRQRPDEFLDARIIEAEGLDAAVRDFLAGMTDRFAIALFERLFIPRPWIGPMAWNQL